jgi:Na+/H+ antiporter NhaD/arsenite permease-like protein
MLVMQLVTVALFVFAYYFIITGKMDKAGVSFVAGALIIGVNSVTGMVPHLAINHVGDFVDFDTIALLLGLMVIIPFMGDAGVFQFLAVLVLKISKGNLKLLYILTAFTVALSSAFLNNVSTVMVFVPVILAITESLDKDPFPFLMMIIFSANFGGGMTLIGDPPNMIVGFANHFSFIDFAINATPGVVLAMVVVLFLWLRKEKDYFVMPKKVAHKEMDPFSAITDKKLALKSSLTFLGAIGGFVLPQSWNISPSTVAIVAAALLLLLIDADSKTMEKVYARIDWPTIFFFIGMFALVYALEQTGIADMISSSLSIIIPNNFVLTIVVFWLAMLMASILSAVPTVMIMIPIIHGFEKIFGANSLVWWALVMGQCLGGNLTIVGAAANMVVAGMTQKLEKGKLEFNAYFKYALPAVIISGITASAYLVARYVI